MPSPVGHTLAGLCGYVVAQGHVAPDRRGWLLTGSVVLANLPDLDFLPGLLLGDPMYFHRQGRHSITTAIIVGLVVSALAMRWKWSGITWGIWGGRPVSESRDPRSTHQRSMVSFRCPGVLAFLGDPFYFTDHSVCLI